MNGIPFFYPDLPAYYSYAFCSFCWLVVDLDAALPALHPAITGIEMKKRKKCPNIVIPFCDLHNYIMRNFLFICSPAKVCTHIRKTPGIMRILRHQKRPGKKNLNKRGHICSFRFKYCYTYNTQSQ